MLTHFTVQNIALVERLELAFDAGMSVITGETGAGKSIMLDALGLALGDRAESGLVSFDADKAEVHANFDLSGNEAARAWLEERELSVPDDECILRRVVTRDGRSRAFINGAPVTVTDLRSLGNMLIDIHSQHEHQSLLKKETHRRLLDEFGRLADTANAVKDLYDRWEETGQRLAKLTSDNEEQAARLQLLTYQAGELEALDAQEGEAQSLEAEQKLLANAESLLRSCGEALALCSEDEETNAASLLARAINLLRGSDIEALGDVVEALESSRIQVEEAAHDIARFADSVALDPERLQQVEARLSELYDMARKHRVEPDELPARFGRISEEIAELSGIDDQVEELEAGIKALEKEYYAIAETLGKQRRKAAKALTAQVTEQLGSLGMKGAVFEVALTTRQPGTPHPQGMEDIEFLVSTNPGQSPRALNRIASGGELSRISLAIQVVTADTSRVPTLVFDEVDVGIGGAVAEVVGARLRQLGDKAQIVCVTHLPQVAAQGQHHYCVVKSSGKKRASTTINPLSSKERVEEIARMLGGIEITRQSLAHAEEMLAAGQR